MQTEVRLVLDVPFAEVPTRHGTRTLVLDLWLPQPADYPLPLIVYIHGGGWQQGVQWRPPFQPRFVDQGIAIAAITYRFSHEAPFPASLFDCKTALRWLRAHAAQYMIDPARIGTWGISAGGHLAALLGVTNGLPAFEGAGPHGEYTSDVCAVCSWCGPTDLLRVFSDPDPGQGMPELVSGLLGDGNDCLSELARQASPITHVRSGAPPFLLIHGSEDPIVPPYHSSSMHQRLVEVGVASELHIMPEMNHTLDSPVTARIVDRFFNTYLRP